jgi:hypothetical protein
MNNRAGYATEKKKEKTLSSHHSAAIRTHNKSMITRASLMNICSKNFGNRKKNIIKMQ